MARAGVKRTVLVLLFAGLGARSRRPQRPFRRLAAERGRVRAHAIDARTADAGVALANLDAAQASYLATGQTHLLGLSRGGTRPRDRRCPDRAAKREPVPGRRLPLRRGRRRAAGPHRARRARARRHRQRTALRGVRPHLLDGLGTSRRLAQELASARDLEAAQSAAQVARIERWRMGANGGAAHRARPPAAALRRGAQAETAVPPVSLRMPPERPAAPGRRRAHPRRPARRRRCATQRPPPWSPTRSSPTRPSSASTWRASQRERPAAAARACRGHSERQRSDAVDRRRRERPAASVARVRLLGRGAPSARRDRDGPGQRHLGRLPHLAAPVHSRLGRRPRRHRRSARRAGGLHWRPRRRAHRQRPARQAAGPRPHDRRPALWSRCPRRPAAIREQA